VLQCAAVCDSVLQSVAVVGTPFFMQCVAVCCSMLQSVAVVGTPSCMQCVAVCCSVVQRAAACCSVLRRDTFHSQGDGVSSARHSYPVCCSGSSVLQW